MANLSRFENDRAELEWARGGRGSPAPERGFDYLKQKLLEAARSRIKKEQPIHMTLPPVAKELYSMVSDPNIGLPKIAKTLRRDPVLAGRLLELANSSFYCGDRPTESIDAAVLRVGTDCIRTAVLLPVLEAKLVRDETSSALWAHSSAVASASPFIAALAGASPDAAYLAGLLHDSGKILIWQDGEAYQSEYGGMLTQATSELHETVGGELMARWSLGGAVAYAVAHHHDPDPTKNEGDQRLAHVVAIADQLVTAEDEGRILDVEAMPEVVALGLRPTPVRALQKRMKKILADAAV